mgnify:CR=1 FL=1
MANVFNYFNQGDRINQSNRIDTIESKQPERINRIDQSIGPSDAPTTDPIATVQQSPHDHDRERETVSANMSMSVTVAVTIDRGHIYLYIYIYIYMYLG